jgi:hypothetical protein
MLPPSVWHLVLHQHSSALLRQCPIFSLHLAILLYRVRYCMRHCVLPSDAFLVGPATERCTPLISIGLQSLHSPLSLPLPCSDDPLQFHSCLILGLEWIYCNIAAVVVSLSGHKGCLRLMQV